ncbi:MAG: GGDEF domain-containing protein, partial [Gammaproteobacteria bacterium]
MEQAPPFELSGASLDDFSCQSSSDGKAVDDMGSMSNSDDDAVVKALDFAHLPLLVLCAEGCIRVVNAACVSALRIPESALVVGCHFDDFLREYFQFVTTDFRNRLGRAQCFSARLPDANGQVSWRICVGDIVNGRRYVVLQDGGRHPGPSDSRTEDYELDVLTGLGNQKLFARLVDEAEVDISGDRRAVLIIDLDDFRSINDRLGREVGDRIIQLAAARLRRAIRPSDPILRLGGDEFVVLLEGDFDSERLLRLSQRVIDVMSRAFLAHGQQVDVSASVGVALTQPNASRWVNLVRQAESALTIAKQSGSCSFHIFTPERDVINESRLLQE